MASKLLPLVRSVERPNTCCNSQCFIGQVSIGDAGLNLELTGIDEVLVSSEVSGGGNRPHIICLCGRRAAINVLEGFSSSDSSEASFILEPVPPSN